MFKDNLVSLRKMHGFSQDELSKKIELASKWLRHFQNTEKQENLYLILRSVNFWLKYWISLMIW